jgi:hypothetical protein
MLGAANRESEFKSSQIDGELHRGITAGTRTAIL